MENVKIQINKIPFSLFSTYTKEVDIDFDKNELFSYVGDEKRFYLNEEDNVFYYMKDNEKIYPSKNQILYDVNNDAYVVNKNKHLHLHSLITPIQSNVILFLKIIPYFLLFLVTFHMPIDFSMMFEYFSNVNISYEQVFEIKSVIALGIAAVVLLMMILIKNKIFFFTSFSVFYIIFFFLSFKYMFLSSVMIKAVVYTASLWSVFNIVIILKQDNDDYFHIEDAKKIISFRILRWYFSFNLGGFYAKIID